MWDYLLVVDLCLKDEELSTLLALQLPKERVILRQFGAVPNVAHLLLSLPGISALSNRGFSSRHHGDTLGVRASGLYSITVHICRT